MTAMAGLVPIQMPTEILYMAHHLQISLTKTVLMVLLFIQLIMLQLLAQSHLAHFPMVL